MSQQGDIGCHGSLDGNHFALMIFLLFNTNVDAPAGAIFQWQLCKLFIRQCIPAVLFYIPNARLEYALMCSLHLLLILMFERNCVLVLT